MRPATLLPSSGSIADTRPRESLSRYLSVHIMLGAVQLVMAALGIALMTRSGSACEGVLTDEAVRIIVLVVTTSQVRASVSSFCRMMGVLLRLKPRIFTQNVPLTMVRTGMPW